MIHERVLRKAGGRVLTLYGRRSLAGISGAPSPRRTPHAPNPHLRWQPLRGERVAYVGHSQHRTSFCRAPVGMDQMVCSVGRDREAIFLDTRSRHVKRVRFPDSLDLLVLHSGVTHAHAECPSSENDWFPTITASLENTPLCWSLRPHEPDGSARFLERLACMHAASPIHRLDVMCLSHLRWNFVFQRPQHLLTRCAREHRVFFVEEPIFESDEPPSLRIESADRVTVVVPRLPGGLSPEQSADAQRMLLDDFIRTREMREYVLWYYTPMALGVTRHLSPRAVIYDCMDELSAFDGAPAALREHEAELMERASLVLTGGRSLYEAKRHLHHNIHALPSSVDVAHFARARAITADPPDQAAIPHPRLGFFGVLDERLDIGLVGGLAAARPDWQLVMIGPVVKIDPACLPRRANIHYLGAKSYTELPEYLAGWNVALLPFARNEATRLISPTKTPEYLAAGKPVVSTSIRDVVRPYGEQGLARIADDVPAFVDACAAAMAEDPHERITAADAFLRQTSWDGTWTRMRALLHEVLLGSRRDIGEDGGIDAAAV